MKFKMLQIQSEVEKLDQFYTFKDKEKVLTYLEQHPSLIPLVLEAPAQIKRYFPNDELVLEVVRDIEDLTWIELVIWIMVKNEKETALERWETLGDAWWLDVMERGLEIMFDYI